MYKQHRDEGVVADTQEEFASRTAAIPWRQCQPVGAILHEA